MGNGGVGQILHIYVLHVNDLINRYFWIQRGVNMCGLADCASYPIV